MSDWVGRAAHNILAYQSEVEVASEREIEQIIRSHAPDVDKVAEKMWDDNKTPVLNGGYVMLYSTKNALADALRRELE